MEPDKWNEELWKDREFLDRAVTYVERVSTNLRRMEADAPDDGMKRKLREAIKKIEHTAFWIVSSNIEIGTVELPDKEDDDG